MSNAATIAAFIAVAAVLGAPTFFCGSLLLHLVLVASNTTDQPAAAVIDDGIKLIRLFLRLPLWVALRFNQLGVSAALLEIVDVARRDPAKVCAAVLASARRPARFVLRVLWLQSLVISIVTVTAIAICLRLALLLALSTMLVVIGIIQSLIKAGIKAGIDCADYAARLATAVTCVWRGGMAQMGIDALLGLRLTAAARRRYRPFARPYTPRAGLVACSEAAWCQTLAAAVTLWLSGVADPFGNVTELGDDGHGLAHDADYVTDVVIAALKTMARLCLRANADKAANRARRVWQQDPANFRKARILAAKDCASKAAKEAYYRCAMDVVYLTCATPLPAPRAAPFGVNNRPQSWGHPAWNFMRFTIRPRVNAMPRDVRKKLLKAAHEA